MAGLFGEWFYLEAPRLYWRFIAQLTRALYEYFSISRHFFTLFEPWRHDAVSLSRLPLNMWGRALLNNFVSRMIGFILRSGVIILGAVTIAVADLLLVLGLIAWLGLPVILTAQIIYGLILIGGGYG